LSCPHPPDVTEIVPRYPAARSRPIASMYASRHPVPDGPHSFAMFRIIHRSSVFHADAWATHVSTIPRRTLTSSLHVPSQFPGIGTMWFAIACFISPMFVDVGWRKSINQRSVLACVFGIPGESTSQCTLFTPRMRNSTPFAS